MMVTLVMLVKLVLEVQLALEYLELGVLDLFLELVVPELEVLDSFLELFALVGGVGQLVLGHNRCQDVGLAVMV